VSEHGGALAHQFDDLEQQHEASTLGMWVFLTTEILFFGGLFLGYAVYRGMYSEAFHAASRHLDVVLGTVNTAVLLSSSLAMALAVHATQSGARRKAIVLLLLTIALGSVFLGIKGLEYYHKYQEHFIPGPNFHFEGEDNRHPQIFFSFYFVMTGMHALHMVIGMGLMLVMIQLLRKGRLTPEHFAPVEVTGLYWHFVDIVWVFLFPLLYLIDRSGGGGH
jgi:cytochrome c oxidase subunit 3